ncbi:hypothetical protein FGM00_09185 [Aggregatimonas sangjinii]|uniref:Immunoglobulin domain-containing protein n=1 Tax=Aggregatimonas sangjinii TaxID=2583587 RepID=A0A5B7SNS9_9FLAO|nr:metallophosphoesterase [Aggregatimonas sangjinii]QCX00275.1 hypothetical protein FGM00_09185 [Aggregatimonas sangjinii]
MKIFQPYFASCILLFCSSIYAQDFAVIGDYGVDDSNELAVSELVKSWNPEFILTVGDNNYVDGEASTIDPNIGKYYSDFIYPYNGIFGEGASVNQFFPSPGNHDYDTNNAQPYYDYFELPGNERYYDFVKGDVHFFSLNSNIEEPDGVSASSVQGQWLRQKLAASTSKWKIVYFHHTPFSSGYHGSNSRMQWPYRQWGATAVIYGHDHHYERIEIDRVLYFVNGSGGRTLRSFTRTELPDTKVRYADEHGAMRINASANEIRFRFFNVNGDLIDSRTLSDDSNQNPDSTQKTYSIDSGANDVEEADPSGRLYVDSSDLELGFDGSDNQNFQTVGLRYRNIDIPKGARITEAYLDFTVDESGNDPSNVSFQGQLGSPVSSFDPSRLFDLSDRPKTVSELSWNPDPWLFIGEEVRSPNLALIIQEIIDDDQWESGNTLALFMKGDMGTRTADSFEGGGSNAAPRLKVIFEEGNNTSCQDGEIIPEWRLNGVWNSGQNTVTVQAGDEVVLSMLPNNVEVEITLPDGTVRPDNYNLGSVTNSDSGRYTLTKPNGCSEVLNLVVEGSGNCAEDDIIPEWRLNGLWESGSNSLVINEGDELVLSILPNNVPVAITLPDGTDRPDDFNLGSVSMADSGPYTLTRSNGCSEVLNLIVQASAECDDGQIIPEWRLNGEWRSGQSNLSFQEGDELMLSMLPNNIQVTITLPDGSEQPDDYLIPSLNSSNSGVYILTRNDGCSKTIDITVNDGNTGASNETTYSLTNGNQDVEEREGDGRLYANSSDLELGFDSYLDQNNQTIGIYFEEVDLPKNASVSNAFLEFTVDEVGSGSGTISIHGERSGDARSFDIGAAFEISGRSKTSQNVLWNPDDWNVVGAKKQSPDLSNIINEITSRSDWTPGNAIVFVITVSGTTRTVESYEGSASNSAKLFIATEDSSTASLKIRVDSELKETETNVPHLYPNPTENGTINIKLQEPLIGELTYELLDATRRRIGEGSLLLTVKKKVIRLNISSLESAPAGIYYLSLSTAGKFFGNFRVLKN